MNVSIFAAVFGELKNWVMKICEITGKTAMAGNNVSHSKRKTKRRFHVNLQTKKFYVPEEDQWVTLKVSAAGIRNINKKGISACLKEAKEKGYLS
ncbi:MAG: 50S ribosomal protein L28 [Flavobacteriales bacterium]|jgi:large subunit ribosomal protein L28|nr:50S ribosomal protein L28 [Flavobacteriales bacterium]NCG30497.1 50S ribosomal protein L28 [Bacteroidota bacterium]MBT3963541.1 50S ribosomal protein L28 [Flavobacteriales bacterium]MBT4705367.1 50S ribosomal protein L28 [Flavobacteriales bacterium]MBT4929882.1 50S ribosomal protein L28 [Flavobacteriales bacterium]